MAFTVSAIAAKDGAGSTVTGGLLALDQTGSGPWIIVHSLVDGVAGSNRAAVDSSNQLKVAVASGGVASGAIASGAVASGAFASGALASGSVASGAFASGALASGSVADGAMVTLGAKADAKSTATDTTAITLMQVAKQISASVQAIDTDILAATITTVAHDAVGTGVNPLLQGGYASAAAPSDVSADGDAVRAWRLRNGAAAAVLTAAGALIGGDATNGLDVDVTRLPALEAGTATIGGAFGFAVTCSTDITRPADTNAYIANDAWANSTSAPTSGGFTLTSAARISGGSGIITDIFILSSAVPGTLLQAQLHIFDAAVTEINDNAAFALSDADAKLAVAVVPFTLVANASNSYYHAQNLNIGFTCVGTANLRYLVKVINAYTPISGEVLTVRAKIIQSN